MRSPLRSRRTSSLRECRDREDKSCTEKALVNVLREEDFFSSGQIFHINFFIAFFQSRRNASMDVSRSRSRKRILAGSVRHVSVYISYVIAHAEPTEDYYFFIYLFSFSPISIPPPTISVPRLPERTVWQATDPSVPPSQIRACEIGWKINICYCLNIRTHTQIFIKWQENNGVLSYPYACSVKSTGQ